MKENVNHDPRWIDVHNDDVMIEMGFFRPVLKEPRDKEVWTRTESEKKILRTLRRVCKRNTRYYSDPFKFIPVPGTLIIQLKKNKIFPYSTYSKKCWQSDIQRILSKYKVPNPKNNTFKSLVVKYIWNGKTYNPNELPFWGVQS